MRLRSINEIPGALFSERTPSTPQACRDRRLETEEWIALLDSLGNADEWDVAEIVAASDPAAVADLGAVVGVSTGGYANATSVADAIGRTGGHAIAN